MANALAIRLDREGVAEMSCIAGVAGAVKSLVHTARSGREIIALDGCPLQCVRECLKSQSVEPNQHITLSDFKVKKSFHEDFDQKEFEDMYEHLRKHLK